MASSNKSKETIDACVDLQKIIESAPSNINYFLSIRNFETADQRKVQLAEYKKKFEASKCAEIIGQLRTEAISGIYDVYSEMDKERIETESKYRAKQKIFFGGVIFMGAVLIVTMFGKKK